MTDRRADRPPRHRPLPHPDLALRPGTGAARRDLAAALRAHTSGPGPHDREGPLRRGEWTPSRPGDAGRAARPAAFNLGRGEPVQTRFNGVPGVVYAAGVARLQLAVAFRDEGLKAQAVSGETPKRELASILARYERGDIDVLINAQLLAEGWNSPRATSACTSRHGLQRIYSSASARHTASPGKEAGLVVDFVHPHQARRPVVTLHSLLTATCTAAARSSSAGPPRARTRCASSARPAGAPSPSAGRRSSSASSGGSRSSTSTTASSNVWAALAGARVQPTAGGAHAPCSISTVTASCAGASRDRVQRNPNPACG